jgi:predicted nucleic acid-binding Zn finger protein
MPINTAAAVSGRIHGMGNHSFSLLSRKIDEPKTPFVRYDAENDMVLGGGFCSCCLALG